MHHLSALLNGVGEDLKQDDVVWSVAGVNDQQRFAWIEEKQQRRTLSRIPPPGAFLDSAPPKYGEEIDISSNVVRFGIAIAAVFVVTSVAFVITGVAEDAPEAGPKPKFAAPTVDFAPPRYTRCTGTSCWARSFGTANMKSITSKTLSCGCWPFLFAAFLTGCGDVEFPDVDELTGSKESAEAENTQAADTQQEPAQLSPEQVIAHFQAKSSLQVTDDDLRQLAAQSSGLEKVTEIDLSAATVSLEGLKSLAALPNLKKLNLQATNVTDRQWTGLGELKSLEVLNISRTVTSDASLAEIGKLTGLKSLNVAQTQITDEGFASLSGLSNLEELNVSGIDLDGSLLQYFGAKGAKAPLKSITANNTRFGNLGFVYIKELPNIQHIHSSHAQLTDGSMNGLRTVRSLITVEFSNNLISNDGVIPLAQSAGLQKVALAANRAVGDKGISRLSRLNELKALNVQDTSCTPDGLNKLKKLCPECMITFEGRTL